MCSSLQSSSGLERTFGYFFFVAFFFVFFFFFSFLVLFFCLCFSLFAGRVGVWLPRKENEAKLEKLSVFSMKSRKNFFFFF